MQKKIITTVVACLIVGALSFAGGMMVGKRGVLSAVTNGRGTQGAGGAFGGQGFGGRNAGQSRGGAFNGLANGEILSKDSTGITLKLRNGGSQIVLFTPTTKTEKMVDGTADDLVVGKQITVMGTTNSDGSITAQSVQLRPLMPLNTSSTNPTK